MDTMTIVMLALVGVMLVAYPIMMMRKNKKDKQNFQEMSNSIKRGDKVTTYSGVYGTVTDIHQEGDRKIVTIETGMGKSKGYIGVVVEAIYSIDNPETVEEPKTNESKVEENKEQSTNEDVISQATEVQSIEETLGQTEKPKKNKRK